MIRHHLTTLSLLCLPCLPPLLALAPRPDQTPQQALAQIGEDVREWLASHWPTASGARRG